MSVIPHVIICLRLVALGTEISQYEKDFAKAWRSKVKIVHSFIPNRNFSAWHISSGSPTMRFTLHKNWRLTRSQIKLPILFGRCHSDWHRIIAAEQNTL